jgi:urease accessory protein
MQLADSFFPSGMFGNSSGLEAAVKSGLVKTRRDVQNFVLKQIAFQMVPCDCVILSRVIAAARRSNLLDAAAADRIYYSMKQVEESRTASVRSGRQLLESVIYMSSNPAFAKKFRGLIDKEKTPGTYPVCLAIASWSLGLPRKAALRLMLYGYTVSVTAAAVRLGIIQHFDAQKILSAMNPEVEKAINSVGPSGGSEFIWQFTPYIDIMQMRHEQDSLRMFVA